MAANAAQVYVGQSLAVGASPTKLGVGATWAHCMTWRAFWQAAAFYFRRECCNNSSKCLVFVVRQAILEILVDEIFDKLFDISESSIFVGREV